MHDGIVLPGPLSPDLDELRGVRLQLDFLRAEIALKHHGVTQTVVVFGSTRLGSEHPCYAIAREFGARISALNGKDPQRHWVVMTGGGPGIMEAANRGAADVGAQSAGLNIELPDPQPVNHFVTPELRLQFHYFAIRKLHLLMRARALVVFPGGFGTFDELFEVLTLVQTRKIAPLPIVLVCREFWRRAVDFEFLVAQRVVDRRDLALLQFAENAAEIVAAVTTPAPR